MKTQKTRRVWIVLGLALAVMALCMACESDKDTSLDALDQYFADNPMRPDPRNNPNGVITIRPANATVTFEGQTVIFSAVGGKSPYIWDVVYPGRGMMNVRADDQGIYTARSLEQNTVLCFDSAGHSGVAQILTSTTNAPSNPLAISPPTITLLLNNDTRLLTASGGTPPYSWSVGNEGLGSITTAGGASATYRRLSSGDTTVTVIDSASRSVSIPVSQP